LKQDIQQEHLEDGTELIGKKGFDRSTNQAKNIV